MSAQRLISLVLLLQTRGALNADALANELQTSVRTVHRDVEALRAAGVPIRGERGPAGGYRLPGGYRTRLTGLTPGEAEALFLQAPAADLGMAAVLADAQLKLLAALPPDLRARADRTAELFHVVRDGWWDASAPPPHLPVVADAVWRGRRLTMSYKGRERHVGYERLEYAEWDLLPLGPGVEVIDPPELRARMAAVAAATAARYAP